MGMYTQVRGILCVASIGRSKNLEEIKNKLLLLQNTFEKREDLDRPWVCGDTCFQTGSNGSGWLFIGSEHKNYDSSIDEWLKYLIKNIPCEGRIEFQYEETELGENSPLWLVKDGVITETSFIVNTEGYGFGI